jgi:N-glycosylase/DNA lyase
MGDGAWLREFLQLDVVWAEVMATLPDDLVMRRSVAACRGLRVLAQPPWECLASFVLSSTKRISQIRQIIGLLCQRFGAPVITPPGHETTFGFPTAEALAGATERELRDCKAGFRAPYLRSVAEAVACGQFVLADLTCRSLPEARAELMRLPGVGRKIADCVLLFSLGYREAFPVDTWVLRALRAHYFGGRHVSLRQVLAFAETYFGPWAGYAQQYLFHAARLASQRSELTEPGPPAPAIDPGRSDESPR